LKQIATHIVGVDIAPEMSAWAPADPQITYLVASAEQLPTLETPFNLMTLSSVFHWIRSEAFEVITLSGGPRGRRCRLP
jgi:ubiquinone/menaquinone biosynthesis C-methylase UbiE